jgi:hypothetical protein
MAQDLQQWWGQDLALSPSGDLATAYGLNKDNQRIFRRLCTNGSLTGGRVGEYLFHPTYGGSAPWYVGRTTDELLLEGIVRSQMYLEASVLHDPEPDITATLHPDGSFQAVIKYTNAAGLAVPPLLLELTV